MGSDIDERVADLEKRLADLESRSTPSVEAASSRAATVPVPDPETFWALAGLRERIEPPGAVLITGSVMLPNGAEAQWQEGLGVDELLDLDGAQAAESLAALGHPVRLQMLQQVLGGVHTAAALTATDGLGTSGQVYYHLRLLIGTGWLRARQRGSYEVPASRVVPLLVTMLAARR